MTHDVAGSSRFLRTTTSRFVFVVMVIIVFAATAAIIVTLQARQTRNELRNLGTARYLTAKVHQSLAEDISGIMEFQRTGDEDERRDSILAQRELTQSLDEIESLTLETRPETRSSLMRLSNAIHAWHRTVAQQGMLKRRLEDTEALHRIAGATTPLEKAHETTADLQGSIEREADIRRHSLDRYECVNIGILMTGGIAGLVLAWTTLRTAKQAEHHSSQLRSALRLRDETLRVLSHDLRNPMNNIMLAGHLLANEPWIRESPEHMRNVQVIQKSVKLMDDLTRDFLDMARIESGRELAIKPAIIDCAALVHDVCEGLRMPAATRDVQLGCVTQYGVVYADPSRLRQVLVNLTDNAIKFTPGGGSIVVSCRRVPLEMLFSVSDTGPGIPAADKEHVFDAFWHRSKSGATGTGLGLFIAKQIVEQHGGRIWIEGRVAGGTTMSFSIPIGMNW